jgi:hypothetical protein
MQHGPVSPPHQPHHGVIVGPGHPKEVRRGVAKLMYVNVSDPCLRRSPPDGLVDAVGGHRSGPPRP